MARNKRKVTEVVSEPSHNIEKNKEIQAGVYRRLSVEQDGDNELSDSIINQLTVVQDYVNKKDGINIKKVYTDDGYSGMSYQRPGFQEMMKDLQSGLIQCVIVKDISRLGRELITTSELVEKVFPEMKIRFICVNDNFDSFEEYADSESLLLQIKMVMNDNYCKDFSRKIRSSINAKMDSGEFMASSGSIPYGYVRNKKKMCFDIDEEVAPIVREIFEMRADGQSYSAIARH